MSSAVDPDVARTVNSGRETLGAMLSAAQSHLQKVFILFVVGLIGTVYALRIFVWAQLRADLNTNPDISIIAVTPFDVILLQVKIGLVVGVVLALPLLIYYARDALKERGVWPTGVPRWKLAALVAMAILLFLGGAAYAYAVFFPAMFNFLASNAVAAELEPTYSIVKWAQFIFLLTASFGFAAQLPLVMSGLAYTKVVRYETFRDRWKYAVLGIFAFGAVFSPPDPFTQIMWAVPLLVLYAFSVGLTKFVVTAQESSERIGLRNAALRNWNLLAAAGLLAGGVTYVVGRQLAAGTFDPYFASVRIGAPHPSMLATVTAAVLLGGLAAAVALGYALVDELEEAPPAESGPAPASAGSPAGIDLSELDAEGVRAAPVEAFAEMEEEQALALASEAMEADDPDKAQAILDRFDAADEMVDATPVEKGATAEAANYVNEDGELEMPDEDEEESGNVFASTGAGMLNAFTEDEIDEDDVGGYYYDFAFILESLTSKAFWLVGWFMLVLAGVFFFLYQGGIGLIKRTFLSRLPASVRPDQVDIVTLHPVEALIFEVKVSTLVAAMAVLPMLLYFAWPALKERGFARGDRNVLLVWGVSLFVGLVGGALFGFLYVAPTVISWLAADVVQANMVIAYRVNAFGWLVFFTTLGVGLLGSIPVSMLLFAVGGLVPYSAMRRRWREVTIAVFAVVAVVSPRGVFMMFIIGVPVMIAYALGLLLAGAYTLVSGGGGGGREVEPAD